MAILRVKRSQKVSKSRVSKLAEKLGILMPRQADYGLGDPNVRSSTYWDLYRDGISQSGLHTFLTCREQFRLKYVEGYRRRVFANAAEFGNLWHKLIELEASGKLRDPAIVIRDFYQKFMDGERALERADQQKLSLICSKTKAMWRLYRDAYRKLETSQYTWKGNEVPFRQDVWEYCPGMRTFPLKGIFDGIVKWKGEWWLFETKTKGTIDEYMIEDAHFFDLQCGMYLNVAERKYGKKFAGVIYNVIRNPQTRKGANESDSSFSKKLVNDITKRPRHYFKRYVFRWSPERLLTFRTTVLDPMLTELALWVEGRLPHYVNQKNLTSTYGKCDMFGPITTGDFSGISRVPARSVEEK